MRLLRLVLLVSIVLFPLIALASPEAPKSDYNPPLAKASDEAEKAIPRFQLDKSLKVEVWAAEPLLANPVAFASTRRAAATSPRRSALHHGVTDTRGHMYWLDDDLACRTVADRVAMYKKHAGKKFSETYEKERDRVRLRRGHRRRRQGGRVDRLRRRLQPGRGRHRRRRARPQGERLLHLHPRPVAAEGHEGRPARPT